jgi:hypothetical protein
MDNKNKHENKGLTDDLDGKFILNESGTSVSIDETVDEELHEKDEQKEDQPKEDSAEK